MASSFTRTHRVEFAETDMAGIGHFSNFFRWMEATEHAFLRSLGATVHGQLPDEQGGGTYGFARVQATCDYRRPVRFEDEIHVELKVLAKSSKSLEYAFEFREAAGVPADAPGTDSPLATGRMKVVCVSFDSDGGRLRAADIPSPIADLVEAAS